MGKSQAKRLCEAHSAFNRRYNCYIYCVGKEQEWRIRLQEK